MCVTFKPAALSRTVVYAGESTHKGKYVHVLGYQNHARNRAGGPNAMILPIPSAAMMGPENVVDISKTKRILRNYEKALEPQYKSSSSDTRSRGFSKSLSIQVFETGIYTVVMAANASAAEIEKALNLVPTNKRPALNPELLGAYSAWYPGWTIAVCCFMQTHDEPDPLVWWYEPMNHQRFFVPTLDSHTGEVPDVLSDVELDHTFVFGSTITPDGVGVEINNEAELSRFLPTKVSGKHSASGPHISTPNGDRWLDVDQIMNPFAMVTEPPPGYVAKPRVHA